MLGVGQCALSPFSAAAVFPRVLRSPALLALRVLLPLLLIQLDRFHHGLSGMAELRDVSLGNAQMGQLLAGTAAAGGWQIADGRRRGARGQVVAGGGIGTH